MNPTPSTQSQEQAARASKAVSRLLNRFLVRSADGEARPLPYNPVDYQTLRYLADHPDARATDLARHVGTPATTMQSALDRLVRRDLLQKRASETDGRARLYRLSAKGREVQQRIKSQDHANMAAMLAELPASDRGRFIDLLERLAE